MRGLPLVVGSSKEMFGKLNEGWWENNRQVLGREQLLELCTEWVSG
jgi:hypothetical protein